MNGDLISEFSIDIVFLKEMQGTSISSGYVPDTQLPDEGVHIANGLNLGRFSLQQLKALNLSPVLVGKLYPYVGKTGDEIRSYLKQFPLRLSENELDIITSELLTQSVKSLISQYESDAQTRFNTIPKSWRTVIASIYLQYPDLPTRYPEFWELVISEKWDAALTMLRSFNDKYITRRNTEADYIIAQKDD